MFQVQKKIKNNDKKTNEGCFSTKSIVLYTIESKKKLFTEKNLSCITVYGEIYYQVK